MGFLKKIRPGGSVPDWAAFMAPSEYARFRKLVDGWLAAHSRGVVEADGGGLDVDMGSEQPMMIGLVNLAQKCHLAAAEDWPELVSDHLDSVLNNAEFAEDMSWDAVKDMLKVRVYPDDYGAGLPEGGEMLVKKPLAGGMIAALAIDYPKTVTSVPPETAARWGRPTDELFEIGLANVRSSDRPSVERQQAEGGATLTILVGDSFFTATWAMMLGDFVTGGSPYGELVVVPNRHVVAFMQIKDLAVVEGITAVIALAADLYRQGPGPITPNVYWRHGGALTLLPTEIEGQTVRFSPPAEFIEMLNQLHKPGAQPN